jgi:hypothetical protein
VALQLKLPLQVLPQLMPVGPLATVPLPVPDLVMVSQLLAPWQASQLLTGRVVRIFRNCPGGVDGLVSARCQIIAAKIAMAWK